MLESDNLTVPCVVLLSDLSIEERRRLLPLDRLTETTKYQAGKCEFSSSKIVGKLLFTLMHDIV